MAMTMTEQNVPHWVPLLLRVRQRMQAEVLVRASSPRHLAICLAHHVIQ